MSLLVLFDVDGTLLLTHDELYVQANADALSEVYGVTEVRHPDDPGDTALHSTRLVLQGAGLDDATIDAGLVAAAPQRALLTGNPEPIARARMVRMGLASFFPDGEGAFGCERERRVALIALALRRADAWAAESAVAVGDTPRDIHTAHEAGIRCIAVSTGAYDRAQLADANQVIATLGELPAALDSLDR